MSKYIYDGHEYQIVSAADRHLVHNNYGNVVGMIFPSGVSRGRQDDGPIENDGKYRHTYAEAVGAIAEQLNS